MKSIDYKSKIMEEQYYNGREKKKSAYRFAGRIAG